MKKWPDELPYNDVYFPIIMNDWMGWEDISDMIDLINDWISNDKPNITALNAVFIHESVGIA